MKRRRLSVNGLPRSRFKNEHGAHGILRPNHRGISSEEPGDPGLFGDALQKSWISNREPQRRQTRATCNIGRCHAKPMNESGRPQHIDFAAWRWDGEAAVESDRLGSDKVLKKTLMYVGSLGYDDGARDASDAVCVILECRIPEILRIMLLAAGEVNFRCRRIVCESKRETDLHGRAIRPFAFALKVQLVRVCDAS